MSTFSVDVDTAGYSNVRRFLRAGSLPPSAAVRVEELVNYFDYDVPAPGPGESVAIATEVSHSPFGAVDHKLVRISLRAAAATTDRARARHLVFLVDVSGSMDEDNKLPLLRRSLTALLVVLRPQDTVAIVTYAGSSGVLLPPTSIDDRDDIEDAIDDLKAGGSTNGASGIQLAYDLAGRDPDPKAIKRVILATDGDFNVGVSDDGSLIRLIEKERERGVFLTVLGFGMGNLNDGMMEQLADHGNGSYAYVDTFEEARKQLVLKADATLLPAAKDTKIQVEWNPARVASYRLIGYENRRLDAQDFNDDKKDAGDIGDGQTVTALYEIELVHAAASTPAHAPAGTIDALKYQAERPLAADAHGDELMTVKVRYKQPDARDSHLIAAAVRDTQSTLEQASDDMRFAVAVAGFGMLLGESSYAGHFDLAQAERLARSGLGQDRDGYRRELVELLALAKQPLRGRASNQRATNQRASNQVD